MVAILPWPQCVNLVLYYRSEVKDEVKKEEPGKEVASGDIKGEPVAANPEEKMEH